MGESAEELRRDIEETRGGLTNTLDAIGDRVSPGRVIERRKNRMVQGVQSVRDRVMGSASDVRGTVSGGTTTAYDAVKDTPDTVRNQTQGSPVVAGAIAFGVGFLVAAILPPSQSEQRAAEGLMDKAEPLKDELASAGREIAEGVKGVAQDAVEEVKATAAESKTAVTDTVHESVDATKSTTQDAASTVKDQATTPRS
jgi:gas vesicle protein